MLQYIDIPESGDWDSPFVLSAENQCWDDATLKQLRDAYHIFFMSSGDSVTPIMVTGKKDNPLIVIGSEDDGTIFFHREDGCYQNLMSAYWIPHLIADLEAAKTYCDHLEVSDA